MFGSFGETLYICNRKPAQSNETYSEYILVVAQLKN